MRVEHIVLVPGLFSPAWMMWPVSRALAGRGATVETWDDAAVFGPVEHSVRRLEAHFAELQPQAERIGVVSHSFGDWLCRQALSRGNLRCAISLVSLVPVVRGSWPAKLGRKLGAGIAAEVEVMGDERRASAALDLPECIDRLVVWARIDPWVRRRAIPGAREVTVPGTHNSLVFQPRVHRLVREHFGLR